MWMRTTINYQYRNGGTFPQALKALYKDGGIPRFYRGVAPALVQGPLSRFGDTAANTGIMTFFDSYQWGRELPSTVKTIGASLAAATWRIFLMPIDTCKTTMQVQGSIAPVFTKVKASGPTVLYHGSLAAASATFVGHYPWFATYNFLSANIAKRDSQIEEVRTCEGQSLDETWIPSGVSGVSGTSDVHTASNVSLRSFARSLSVHSWAAGPSSASAPPQSPTPAPTASASLRSTSSRRPPTCHTPRPCRRSLRRTG